MAKIWIVRWREWRRATGGVRRGYRTGWKYAVVGTRKEGDLKVARSHGLEPQFMRIEFQEDGRDG